MGAALIGSNDEILKDRTTLSDRTLIFECTSVSRMDVCVNTARIVSTLGSLLPQTHPQKPELEEKIKGYAHQGHVKYIRSRRQYGGGDADDQDGITPVRINAVLKASRKESAFCGSFVY
jgi:hypothetical protein